jgi:hypothetical protein
LTHLNGTSRQIVNLSTFCVANTPPNNIQQPFFYDRGDVPFTKVPQGFSFVITDIIIEPCATLPRLEGTFLAFVTIGHTESRRFAAGFTGPFPKHYALTGGLVVPEGEPLTGDNSTFSSDAVNVKVLGYFVRGLGLPEREPFPFHEVEKSDN